MFRVTQLSGGADPNPELSTCEGHSALSRGPMTSCVQGDDRVVGILMRAGGPSVEGPLEDWAGWCSRCQAVSHWQQGPLSAPTDSSRRTCFSPARPWRRSPSCDNSSSRRRRSCCTGFSGPTPPLPSPWPLSPPRRSPSSPARARAWALHDACGHGSLLMTY